MTSKKSKKILFVYRTARGKVYQNWQKGKGPDSLLFGFNHLKKMGYNVDFFDISFSPLNLFHPLFYPFEHTIIKEIGMGFKLDQATILLPRIRNYDVIIGTGDSAGLPLLALKYLGLIKKPIIFMTSGIAGALKGKVNTWVGKFYKKILKEADVITSYSQVETDFFEKEMAIKKGKIKFMPLGTDWSYFSQKSNLKRTIISAVGTELGRDYGTLFEAVKNLPIRVEVACHPDNIKDLTIPKNVKIYLNISIDKVLKLYQCSIISVVPCFERFRSSGQMVVLESAAAGLPIIASEIKGITTAFDFKDKNHMLFTKPQDPKDLRQKIITLLKNKTLRESIAKNGQALVKQNYTTYHLAKRLAEFIDNL